MRSLLPIFCVCFFVTVQSFAKLTCDINCEWENFKRNYKKSYKDRDVEGYRKRIWMENLKVIFQVFVELLLSRLISCIHIEQRNLAFQQARSLHPGNFSSHIFAFFLSQTVMYYDALSCNSCSRFDLNSDIIFHFLLTISFYIDDQGTQQRKT